MCYVTKGDFLCDSMCYIHSGLKKKVHVVTRDIYKQCIYFLDLKLSKLVIC